MSLHEREYRLLVNDEASTGRSKRHSVVAPVARPGPKTFEAFVESPSGTIEHYFRSMTKLTFLDISQIGRPAVN